MYNKLLTIAQGLSEYFRVLCWKRVQVLVNVPQHTYTLKYENKCTVVCKTFFLNTLSISGQIVQTVFIKLGSTGVVLTDRQGKACKNSLLGDSVKQSVRDHINSFETIESHYCRQSTSRQYLSASLSVAKMYTMYLEYCQERNVTSTATECIYRQVFNTKFNFLKPKEDYVIFAICTTTHHKSRNLKWKNILSILKIKNSHVKYKIMLKSWQTSRQQYALQILICKRFCPPPNQKSN